MHSKHSTIYFTKPFKEKFINQLVVGVVGGKSGDYPNLSPEGEENKG